MELSAIPPISISDLRFGYGAQPVLKGFSCYIRPGERVAVLGPNGAGKSTLFHLLGGLLEGYTGSVKLGEREVRTMRRWEIARRLALVPQRHEPVFPFLTRDFILMGRHAHLGWLGIPGPEDLRAVEAEAAAIGISTLLDKPYTQLSGGELQMVLVVRALVQEAPILMLDEPNSHLDFRNRTLVLDLVRGLSEERHLTILMTLHDPNDVIRYAGRVLVIGEGRLLADGPPGTTLTPDLLERLYHLPVASVRTTDGQTFFHPVPAFQAKETPP
jgi:iron complex transport system ATP-binding protein